MKKKDKSTKAEKDKYHNNHENQNVRDFNPAQFVEEDDIDKGKKKKNKDKENKK
ncbi:MAG TPA: hypothetical protein VLZ33_01735 [Dysgonamonadaceae bacterium]|nr:hypothetical protein [Dysgonamonadaceae bacterium]